MRQTDLVFCKLSHGAFVSGLLSTNGFSLTTTVVDSSSDSFVMQSLCAILSRPDKVQNLVEDLLRAVGEANRFKAPASHASQEPEPEKSLALLLLLLDCLGLVLSLENLNDQSEGQDSGVAKGKDLIVTFQAYIQQLVRQFYSLSDHTC